MADNNSNQITSADTIDEIESLLSQADGTLALLGTGDPSHVSKENIWDAIAGVRRLLAQVGPLTATFAK
ncbi:hypothetical protein [Actimicrobium antarcticum]|uniref:Uncharacterized protein n=1 Tax=Actimicrobium antarcticum TaxID=1051899 RepID=A0ABP7TVV2_9BURK